MAKKKKIFITIFIIGLIVVGAIAGTGWYYLLSPQFHPTKTAYLYIDRDDTMDSVYTKLQKVGNADDLTGFRLLVKYKKMNVRTGRYAINRNDNARTVFNRLSGGLQSPVNVTVPSVRTWDKMARAISNQLMIDSAEIASRLYDSEYISKLGYDKESLYCLFIPNTYEVYWNISADDLLERMQREHEHFWNKDRIAKANALNMTIEQICTVASIVDEETNDSAEKPTVAGLYLNRVMRGMPLQADPTVKFALGDFEIRRVTNRDLEIDSPYNTYKYAGLPPGPIRIPSIKAIDSVLDPGRHNYLYMCAKEDFSGSHNFATTLAEHMRNARKYQQALNQRKIFR
ncbi:endolytic transglycosylase MltG [Bacteroides sp. 519]|uniref:endolytic transglycosylase MltG n=1 Tax=Bacteroides sp. 519 TaxID=2302937 RepID=UPI0013D785C8|nr:endolytic transglycosylase MltG [Bacteroides sp. 519]NDV60093.1 endolytic transglycosylase MltG [Bacteroides sp. 519]